MERRQVNRDNHPRRMPPPLAAVDAPVRTTPRPPVLAPAPVGPGPSNAGLRAINIALGAWLFVSAFLWPHGDAAFTNTLVVGALVALFGVFAQRPMPRLVCGALGAWLVLSTLSIMPRMELTFWHNLVVGIAVLVATFLPAPRPRLYSVK